jgi:Zn-dependent protease with chaperone function
LTNARSSCPPWTWLVAVTAMLCTNADVRGGDGSRAGRRMTRYDVATPGDLLLHRLVAPATKGDVEEWSKLLLGGMPGQVGEWAAQYFDARALASVITEAFPIEGQAAAGPVDRLVSDCATTMGVDKPAVYLRNSPECRVYAVEASGRHHLVLTKGLLDLFAGRPDELKFVVGRELGHIRCGHAALIGKSYAVLHAVQAMDAAAIPERFQTALPLLAPGRLFTWCREAEFSADRAGLVCCGDPKVAYQAIMRLQHGLRADSPWIDPAAPEFDARAIVRGFEDWQYRPFARFVLSMKRQPLGHPYYQERLASLKSWVDSGAFRAVLERPGDAPDRLIEVVLIRAYELAAEGDSVDPYVIVTDGDRQVLRTKYASAVREAEWTGFGAANKGVDQPRGFRDGQPLFFEVWDRNDFGDTLVGGFVVYPAAGDAVADASGERRAEYTTKILWDWKEPRAVASPGHADVVVRFSERVVPDGGAAKEGR